MPKEPTKTIATITTLQVRAKLETIYSELAEAGTESTCAGHLRCVRDEIASEGQFDDTAVLDDVKLVFHANSRALGRWGGVEALALFAVKCVTAGAIRFAVSQLAEHWRAIRLICDGCHHARVDRIFLLLHVPCRRHSWNGLAYQRATIVPNGVYSSV